jgi:predicted metal-dependent phosphoesterase TrpH
MSAIYDLHAHSTASDGTLAPAELVAHAHRQGVGVLALTDHDVTSGLADAWRTAQDMGVDLVPGVEISVTWDGTTVHVLGLRIDPDHAQLQQGLAQLRTFRDWRAEEIGRRLARAGVADALEGAMRYARGPIISRTHFARFLVAGGWAKDLRQVFRRYLVRGKPGHVAGQWAELAEAVGWIRSAGGQAVLAHPARYHMTTTRLGRLLDDFRSCGGIGIEVVSGSQTPTVTSQMLGCALRRGLRGSVGSDYHGPEAAVAELGRMPALPAACPPIWQAW